MSASKTKIETSSFSLIETTKPKFNSSQIRIDASKRIIGAGIPKTTRKLVVGRSGKIVFSK